MENRAYKGLGQEMQKAYTNHAVGPDGYNSGPFVPYELNPEDFISRSPVNPNPTTPTLSPQGTISDLISGMLSGPKQPPQPGGVAPQPFDPAVLAQAILQGNPNQAPTPKPQGERMTMEQARAIQAGTTPAPVQTPPATAKEKESSYAPMPAVNEAINNMPNLSRAMQSNDYANPFQSFRKNISAVTQKMANLDLGEEYMSRIFGGQKPEQFFNNVTNVFGQTWGELGNRMTALETLAKKRSGG